MKNKKKWISAKIEKDCFEQAWILHVQRRGEFRTFQEFLTACVWRGIFQLEDKNTKEEK